MKIPTFKKMIPSMQKAFDDAPHFNGIALFEMNNKESMVWQSGYADEGQKIPHTAKTQFSIASISKQFTAIALLLALKEKGVKLPQALQETLGFYLPSYEASWTNQITLHQLLTHTSGLDNYTDFPFEAKLKVINDSQDARKQHIEFIKTLSQKPNKIGIFNYSNTNYHLLSLVVEALTGKMLGDYLHEIIFIPLRMNDTFYFEASNNEALKNVGILTNIAPAYILDPTKPKIEKSPCSDYENYGTSAGDGSMVSTLSDLHTWCVDLFRTNKVIPKEIRELICQPHSYDANESDEYADCWYGYGIGLHKSNNPLLNDFWHDGMTYGYSSYMGYFPALDAIYIKLSNFTDDYFIDARERDVIRQQYRYLDDSVDSEDLITEALEKKYPGYKERIQSMSPEPMTNLKVYLRETI